MTTETNNGEARLICFRENKLWLKTLDGAYGLPVASEVPNEWTMGCTRHRTARTTETETYAIELSTIPNEDGWHGVDLRASYDLLPRADYDAAAEGAELIYWDKHSRFCPTCGTPTEQHDRLMKKCPCCGYELYPPIATATIVLIRRGDEALLVRARNFRGTFHGLVAGFVEPGETLEECVRREVMEETGLRIKHVTYFDSQPWPYPCGLMVGFNAEYDSGEIALRDGELTSAAFFSRDSLPQLPLKLSIARRLIDNWLANG